MAEVRTIEAIGRIEGDRLEAVGRIEGDKIEAVGEIGCPVYIYDIIPDVDVYDGPYRFTPSEEAQTAHTRAKALTQDVIIEPIPSNYGKITWNGSVLTVS